MMDESLIMIFLVMILIVSVLNFLLSAFKEKTIAKLEEENKQLRSINVLLKEEVDESSIFKKSRR